MIGFFVFAALAGFWVLIVALTKRERGWVGISEAARLQLQMRGALARFQIAVGELLLPALRAMTERLVKVNRELEKTRRL